MKPHVLCLLCACASDADNYCEDIGDCAQGGSFTWVQTCQSNLHVASSEAVQTGCKTQFDAYYHCATSNYTCSGNTALFPNCDVQWSALNACIANAETQQGSGLTWCAQLASATSACSPAPDAGMTQAGCNATRDCEAQCFLVSVSNPCAPDVSGLDAYTQCAASCPAAPSAGDASSE